MAFTDPVASGGNDGAFFASRDMQELKRLADSLPPDAADIVRERLTMAAKVIERTAGRVLPKGAGTAWPSIVRTIEEVQELEAEMAEEDKPRITFPPTAKQITQAEEAMFWRKYVTEAQALSALNIWMRCKALRIRSWQKEAVRHGFSRETAKRRLARAFFLIAVGLVQDGKEIEEAQR